MNQNLEYARTLLLRLERGTARRPRQRSATADARKDNFAPQRARLKRLHDRLYELDQQYDDDNDDDISSDDEDLLAKYCGVRRPDPAPSASHDGLPGSSFPTVSPGAPSTVTTSTGVRSRNTDSGAVRSLLASTSGSSAQPATPTPASAEPLPSAKAPTSPSAARVLESHDSAQTELTASLLSMAKQLKLSANAINEDLAVDKNALGAAEDTLLKSQTTMEGARRGLGSLMHMTEGRWLWQRLGFYAAIPILWVVLLFIVFFAPKLRF